MSSQTIRQCLARLNFATQWKAASPKRCYGIEKAMPTPAGAARLTFFYRSPRHGHANRTLLCLRWPFAAMLQVYQPTDKLLGQAARLCDCDRITPLLVRYCRIGTGLDQQAKSFQAA
jgi:hypothetical protein